jgi:hypothetical protein
MIMLQGGACRPFLHDRHFSTAFSFQTAVCGTTILRLTVMDDDAPLPVVL